MFGQKRPAPVEDETEFDELAGLPMPPPPPPMPPPMPHRPRPLQPPGPPPAALMHQAHGGRPPVKHRPIGAKAVEPSKGKGRGKSAPVEPSKGKGRGKGKGKTPLRPPPGSSMGFPDPIRRGGWFNKAQSLAANILAHRWQDRTTTCYHVLQHMSKAYTQAKRTHTTMHNTYQNYLHQSLSKLIYAIVNTICHIATAFLIKR